MAYCAGSSIKLFVGNCVFDGRWIFIVTKRKRIFREKLRLIIILPCPVFLILMHKLNTYFTYKQTRGCKVCRGKEKFNQQLLRSVDGGNGRKWRNIGLEIYNYYIAHSRYLFSVVQLLELYRSYSATTTITKQQQYQRWERNPWNDYYEPHT